MKLFPRTSTLSVPVKTAIAVGSALLLGTSGIATAEPSSSTSSNIATAINRVSLADGTYFYGDSPEGNQVGQGYVVFKKHGHNVTGAFFYPHSEFSCFTGKIKNQRLDVLSLGLHYEDAIDVDVPLTKMHQIKAMGSAAKDSLSTCQQEVAAYQQQQTIAEQAQP